MAIYHLSVKTMSRAKGRSAVAAAAYRSGERLTCERRGTTHDYRRRSGVVRTAILVHGGQLLKRDTLWNAVEAAETRVNSVVAREWECSLPHELSPEQRFDLTMAFATLLIERYGIVADIAIHAPSTSRQRRRTGESDGLDRVETGPPPRNHHCHILTSTRALIVGEDGALTFGAKVRQLDGLKSGAAEIIELREAWACLCNVALEAAGSEARVDHRSNEARGIAAIPIGKIGVSGTAIERRTGEKSERRRYLEEQKAEIEARLELCDPRSGVPILLPADVDVFVADCELGHRKLQRIQRIQDHEMRQENDRTLPAERRPDPPIAGPPLFIDEPVRLQTHRDALAALRREAAAVDRALLQALLDPQEHHIAKPGSYAEPFMAVGLVRRISSPAISAPAPSRSLSLSAPPSQLIWSQDETTAIDVKPGGLADAGVSGVPSVLVLDTAVDEGNSTADFMSPSANGRRLIDPIWVSRHGPRNLERLDQYVISKGGTLPRGHRPSRRFRSNWTVETIPEHKTDGLGLKAPNSETVRRRDAHISRDDVVRIDESPSIVGRSSVRSEAIACRIGSGAPVVPFAWPEADLLDVHAAGMAVWAFTLGDAPTPKARYAFRDMMRFVAATIRVSEHLLTEAVSRIRDWLGAGRAPETIAVAMVEGALYAKEMTHAALMKTKTFDPSDLATTDIAFLRKLAITCRADQAFVPTDRTMTSGLDSNGLAADANITGRELGESKILNELDEPDEQKISRAPIDPANLQPASAWRRSPISGSKSPKPSRRGTGIAD